MSFLQTSRCEKCGIEVLSRRSVRFCPVHRREFIGARNKSDPEWHRKKREGILRAWKDPNKHVSSRTPSKELIERRLKGLRAYKITPEDRAKIARSLTGKKLSPEHRAKAVAQLKRVTELTPDQKAKRAASISRQRIGTHGYGRAALDRLDHFNAKHWIIRDPLGGLHECDNLAAFCRANEGLFLPDDFPDSKLPLWRRAVGGFNGMQRTDKKGQHHWKGWMLVSSTELEPPKNGADPLERSLCSNTPAA